MKTHNPPKKMIQLLEWFCDPLLVEGIIGDLEEKFALKKDNDPAMARLLFIWQGLGFIRWRFKRKSKFGFMANTSLWTNYLRISARSVLHNKRYFGINLVGLLFAAACSIYCFVLIQDELKFDQFHRDLPQIFRLYKQHKLPAENIDHLTAETSGLMGPTMLSQYREVEEMTRMYAFDEVLVFKDQHHVKTDSWTFVDSTFFDVFSFDFIGSDPGAALKAPGSVILTETFARKLFGNRSPVGEKIIGFADREYAVTGIVKDPPRHSSLQFDLLTSWSSTVAGSGNIPLSFLNNWLAQAARTYVKLAPNVDVPALESKLGTMMSTYFPERADQYFLFLQPFEKLHLYSAHMRYQVDLKLGSIRFIYILAISALLVLLIVLVNYINITLSRAMDHLEEIGIRKVLGASRRQLLSRFIIETFFSCAIASLLGYLLVMALLPQLNVVTGKDIPISVLFQGSIILSVIGLSATLGLMLGFYPALVLSRPSISHILRGSRSAFQQGNFLKKLLLGFQYAMAIVLLFCTIQIFEQIHFLRNKPLGFDKENLMVIDLENEIGDQAVVFEAALSAHPNIESIAMCRSAIGSGNYSTTLIPEGRTTELGTRIFFIDADFFDTYGMNVSDGRNYHANSQADSNKIIVNRALVNAAGWSDPIGKTLKSNIGAEGIPIVGVVEDFHYHSLATAQIEPMALVFTMNDFRKATLRLGPGDFAQTLQFIEQKWNELATKTPFDYYFVEDYFEDLYQTENQLVKTSSIYAIISLLLCGLGLYGLTSLLLRQRVREISIRKVLGADILSIVSLLNRQFMGIIILSLLAAVPLAIFLMNKWLADFVYRISPNAFALVFTIVIILCISMGIISTLARSAARANPVKYLQE